MFYAVVIGVVCGVSGVFSVMVCCGSGKMKSKRDRDLEDREQLEFCRNCNNAEEKLKMEKEKLKMEKESRIRAILGTRRMLRSREDDGQIEFLRNWKRQNEKREGKC